mmetsp:Transcript_26124/g.38694  ORF Transcript_26124/g.38694 Transcript_26124/m.38694 type:complete len:436 (+) Transcript_26124:52-1359(+)
MDPPENELDIVKRKIAAIEVKIARAEAERDKELIVVYEKQAMEYAKLLAGLQEKENRLSQAAGNSPSTIDILLSKMETMSIGIEALLKYNEDKESVSGSELKFCHYTSFGFGELTPRIVKCAFDYAATRQEFSQIKTCVTQYTQTIRSLYCAKKTEEVDFVQPLSRNLLKELAQAVDMGGNAEVQYKNHSLAVKYDSKEYHIRGEMDAGLFLKDTTFCLCPWEDKNMSNECSWKYVTQCAAEMAGKLEHLKSGYDFIPKRYCGILTNGRWWVIVFRHINSEGRRLWLHTTPIQAIDIAGNIIPRGVYQVIIFLFHAMMISKEVMKALIVKTSNIFDVEKSGRHIDKYSPHEDASSDDDDVKTHSSEGGNIARQNERGRHGENGGKQSGGHQHAGQRYALQDIGNICSPLTVSNIAAHQKLVPKKNVFTEIGLRDY